MDDTYAIGLTLSLDDEVSAGIDAIRAELDLLNQSLGESLAGLAALRHAAKPALSAYGVADTTEKRPQRTRQTPPATETATGAGKAATLRAPAQRPLAPEPTPARAQEAADIASLAPRGPERAPQSTPAPSPRIEIYHAAAPAFPRAEPAVRLTPSPALAPTQMAAPATMAAPSPLALDDLLALTRGGGATPPTSPIVATSPRDAPAAPLALFLPAPASTPAEGETGAVVAPMALGLTRARDLYEPTAPRPAAPAVAAPSDTRGGLHEGEESGNGTIRGDVYLDGMRVGHWMGEQLAARAARPPSGYSGVDSRLAPLWPGAPVVP